MKNKIKLFMSIIIILITFSIKSIAVEPNISSNYTIEQKALREVMNAYYIKGINGQYCKERFYHLASPEEATSQNTFYSDCSNFTSLVYVQAFGIDQVLLGYNEAKINYAKKYYDPENIVSNDVIEYWERTGEGTTEDPYVYKDNTGNVKNINLSTTSGRMAFADKILKEYNLQIGDIICYTTEGNHTLIVYDIIYDENGEPVDALIRDSTSKYEKKTMKLTLGLSFADIFNENNNVNQGTFQECYLKNTYTVSNGVTRSSVVDQIRDQEKFTILRPLLRNENGEYTGKYYDVTFSSATPTGRTLKEYNVTDSTLKRIKYSGIDIEKIVNVYNESVVNLGDTLEYTIKVTNKSNINNNIGITYDNFDIIESISDYVEIIDNGDGIIDGKTIKWNISELDVGKSIEKKYKVKIKNNVSNLGKEILSTGTVAGIQSSTVKNYVSSNLKEEEKAKIKSKAQALLNNKNYHGAELISNVYKQSLGIDLNIENLDITDLVKVRQNARDYNPSNPTIYLNKENNFSNMVLTNYYGGVYTRSSDDSIRLRFWEQRFVAGIESRDERKANIYKENLQTGDVLVYNNSQTTNENVNYLTEEGNYYLIYITEEDKITIDGEEIYGFIGLKEDGTINRIYKEESTEATIYDLRTLLGKDYYSILRPSLVLDIVPMELQLRYNTTEITNQDVQAVITSNEEMLPVEGWTLSEDKKMITKTFNKNTTEELKVYDYGGNEKTVNIKIENIDKEKPILDVNYSTTKATNIDVVVTINSNEEIKSLGGWTLSEDKKTLTKTFTENKLENIEITDLAGNISTTVIDIKNIDKEKPVVEVKYSTQEQTLNDVIVTIEANEELQGIEGWQLSNDKKMLTKAYTKNDEETIAIYDLAGNSVVESIKVENIDKEKPEYELNYSTTLSTNEDVTVTITANEEIQSVEGWTLSEDKKVLTKTYTENVEEEITIKDIVGNSSSTTIVKINNIDRIKPIINISYNITELTNQDIFVTLKANEEIKEIEGWNLSTDKKELTKKFTSNTEENITIYDLAGNTISDTIKITNIDKIAPKIEVNYSTTFVTDKDIIVTITSDKIINDIDGWNLSSDKKQLTKTFKENGEEEITITDEAGNNVTTNIKISNIDKIETKQVDTKVNSNNDTTTAKTILPNTGEKSILIFIVILIIVSTIIYIKLKKYNNIK